MICVIDIGTSSMRAVVFDAQGSIQKKVQRKYELTHVENGGLEMDISLLDGAMSSALEELGGWTVEQKCAIEAISVTSQRSSVIAVDERGRAMAPALMWQDRRAASICEAMEADAAQIFEVCGLRPSPVFSAPKMRYLREQSEGLYQAAHKLIGFQEYVLYWLSGQFATDATIASRTCLYDLRQGCWSNKMLELFALNHEKLCPLTEPGSVVGTTTPEVGRLLRLDHAIPVITAGGDQQCAALGLGCVENGQVVVNSGTGAYVIALTDTPLIDPQMRVNCNASAIPGKWILEGAVLSAGRTILWYNDLFFASDSEAATYDNITNALDNSCAGAHGMLFSNDLAGNGTPHWNPRLRGGMHGLGFHSTREDFSRALFEGVAMDIARCVDIIGELTRCEPPTVKSAGGLTKFSVYNQILADVTHRTVLLQRECEATCLGAWISGMAAMNPTRSIEQIYAEIAGADCTAYQPNREHRVLYDEMKAERATLQQMACAAEQNRSLNSNEKEGLQ